MRQPKRDMALLQSLIVAVRSARKDAGVPERESVPILLRTEDRLRLPAEPRHHPAPRARHHARSRPATPGRPCPPRHPHLRCRRRLREARRHEGRARAPHQRTREAAKGKRKQRPPARQRGIPGQSSRAGRRRHSPPQRGAHHAHRAHPRCAGRPAAGITHFSSG